MSENVRTRGSVSEQSTRTRAGHARRNQNPGSDFAFSGGRSSCVGHGSNLPGSITLNREGRRIGLRAGVNQFAAMLGVRYFLNGMFEKLIYLGGVSFAIFH